MERRSFLKILGLVTGGALIHLPAVHDIERALSVTPELASEFFFKLDGVDYSNWIRVIEPPPLEYEHIEVTSFEDDTEKFILGLKKAPTLELEFAGLPDEMHQNLLGVNPMGFELGHRPSGWSWTGKAFLKSTDGTRFQFMLTEPVEIHANG